MKTYNPGKEAIQIANHIHNWLSEYVPFVKNQSQCTVKGYKAALTLYLIYLEHNGITPSTMKFVQFNHIYVENWVKWLKEERGCKPGTCNVRLAAIKTFLKYIASRDLVHLALSQAVGAISKQKTIKPKVSGISKEAIKILMKMPDTQTHAGRRDMALLVLMYGTAARIDEILSMTVGQLNLQSDKPYATIIGKGSKTRTLYLLPKAVAHLKVYLAENHPLSDGRRFLFYSRNGDKTDKLTQPAIAKRIKQYAAMGHEICSEIPLSLHAHQLRHSKASHWLEDGMNIIQISFLLGHSTVQTTMQYLDITTEHESQALATIEDENERSLPKKWKGAENSLLSLCGLD